MRTTDSEDEDAAAAGASGAPGALVTAGLLGEAPVPRGTVGVTAAPAALLVVLIGVGVAE